VSSPRDENSEVSTARQPADGAHDPAELLLLCLWPDGRALTFPLPASGALAIGRSRASEVRIDEPGVSRTHVRLHLGARVAVEDLESANGTFFRGRLLQPRAPEQLVTGDSFMVGRVLVTLQRRVAQPPRTLTLPSAPAMSEPMSKARAMAERVARGTISVLLLGETGAGKDVMAQHIHMMSPRASRPFLRLNCAALSETLVESELFGHEKGSFTGAASSKPGLLETADGGTLFLDEVGELSAGTQTKLLRVLEQREFFRVGAVRARKVDLRFIAATNRDLKFDVSRGAFRQDLFFRLAGAVVHVPPLRHRVSEIVPFAKQFLAEAAAQMSMPAPEISSQATEWLQNHAWPGNLRELRNAVERALLVCTGNQVSPDDLAAVPPPAVPESERERVVQALAQFGGNQTHAARFLRISRNTLIARMERYGLPRSRSSS
jgi:two-component system, NtrC family, response regulator AtoC